MLKKDSPIVLQNISMIARQLFLLFKKSTTFWDNPRTMTFCLQLALGTISLTSDWVLGDDSKQYRCYIGKIVNKQNIIRDRIPRSRFSYAYTLGL